MKLFIFAVTLNKKIEHRDQIRKETYEVQGQYLEEHIFEIKEKVEDL